MSKLRTINRQSITELSRMELVARQAVEGFLSGRHASPFHGSSIEYADHRPYTIGDELRSLDWKLLAKTDRYYVKLFEAQTNLRCTILLDCSKSMGFGGDSDAARGKSERGTDGGSGSGGGAEVEGKDQANASSSAKRMTKLTYGAHLAAALGYLMLGQNDAVGLTLFDNQVRQYLPPRATAVHFRRMMDSLEQVQADHASDAGPVMHEIAGRIKRRGLVILISDMLDDTQALMHALGHLRHRKHEVLVFHVMDPDELNFPFDRLTRFKDAEGTGTIVTNPNSARKRYLDRLNQFMTEVKGGCLEQAVSYQLASTDTPWDRLLSRYLEHRNRTQ